MSAIAREARLTKGALYTHFLGKSDLLSALVSEFETRFLDQLIGAMDEEPGDALAKLHRLISFCSDFAERNLDLCLLLTIISAELQGADPKLDSELRRVNAKYARYLRRVIEDGKAKGSFKPGLDTHHLAYVIIAFHDGILLQFQRSREFLDGADYVRMFREVVMSGVRNEIQGSRFKVQD
jgi:AcrR family transcriptional regulator